MHEFFSIGILPMTMTLFAYQAGILCQKKFKLPIFNPILVAAIVVLVTLSLIGMERKSYQEGVKLLSWLMTPATVCLAIPMYQQIQTLKKNLKAILAGVAAGTLSCLTMLLVCMLVLGFDRNLIVSLLPKGITTAIGMGLSEELGGMVSVTIASIIISGVTGNMLASVVFKVFRIVDPIAQGLACGTASHAIGTAKAREFGDIQEAMSGLSIAVCGILTVVLASIF